MTTRKIGREVEQALCAKLKRNGLKLISENYSCRLGEIDLIMVDGEDLVFIEVRYRSSNSYGGAQASISAGKQQRIIKAAKHFLMTHPEYTHFPARFDVYAAGSNGEPQWFKSAFTL